VNLLLFRNVCIIYKLGDIYPGPARIGQEAKNGDYLKKLPKTAYFFIFFEI